MFIFSNLPSEAHDPTQPNMQVDPALGQLSALTVTVYRCGSLWPAVELAGSVRSPAASVGVGSVP